MSLRKFEQAFNRFRKATMKDLIGFCVLMSGLLAVLLATGAAKAPDTPAPTAGPTGCADRDLQCVGDKGVVPAGFYCRRAVEHEALHSVRWTDGTFESKFSRFRWAAQGAGAVTFVGDRAEFQNGFGAYTPVVYECDFSSDMKTVLAVRVREGRLPL